MSPTSGVSRAPFVVATTQYRRTIRVVAGNRTQLLAMMVIGLFIFGPLTLVGIALLPTAGREIAAGEFGEIAGVTVADGLAGSFAVAWIAIAVMVTIRAVTSVADVDQPATLLVSTSLRNAVVGRIGGELLVVATWLLPPIVFLSAAFAYGAGTPLPVVFAVLAVCLAMLTAVPVGFVIGICVRHLLTAYEPIARYRTHVFVLLGIVYFGLIFSGWFDRITVLLFDALGGSPLGWPGHLLAVGVPNVTPSTLGAVGAIVGTAVAIPAAVAVAIAAARLHWYADPVRTDDDSASDSDRETGAVGGNERRETSTFDGRFTDVLAIAFDRPVHTVTVTTIRRARRAPIRLLYVAYPLFGAFAFAQQVIELGYVPSYLAVLFCVYVVWAAGALFTLNPLGDFGQALPAVMTSTVSGREVARGGIVAGTLVAVPIALLVSVGAGLASPLTIGQTALLLVVTVVGAIATPALAVGVGTKFPRFGSVKVTNNREAVMPSKTAFLVYSLAIALPAVAAAILYVDWAPDLVASGLSGLLSLVPVLDLSVTIPARTITVVAWAVLVLGLVSPMAGYRYAARRFDRFTIDRSTERGLSLDVPFW